MEQLQEKIVSTKNRLNELTGKDNKNIRKRLYYQLKQMQQAQQDPMKYIVDPIKKKQKREQDQQKRIAKKLQKKEIDDQQKQMEQIQQQQQKKKNRKRGHTIAECRLAKDVQSEIPLNSKICYNCGSTEHTLWNCPKRRKKTLEFAVCFVCKQKGHISRECPQNQNGLYADGGGCYICGDVHHIKKDCPYNYNHQEDYNNQNIQQNEEQQQVKIKKFQEGEIVEIEPDIVQN